VRVADAVLEGAHAQRHELRAEQEVDDLDVRQTLARERRQVLARLPRVVGELLEVVEDGDPDVAVEDGAIEIGEAAGDRQRQHAARLLHRPRRVWPARSTPRHPR
jgi:hypothetical protein